MNPSNPYIREQQSNPIIFRLGIYNQNQYKTSFPINFVALLNHNLASDSNPFLVQGIRQDWADNNYTGHVWDTLTDNSDYKRNIYFPSYGMPSTFVLNLFFIPSDSLNIADDLHHPLRSFALS